jgi:MFS family permease
LTRFGPLHEREFRLLFAGRTISMLGTAMAPIALAFAVLNTLDGSATQIGIVLAARQVPVLLLLLFGGVLADRIPRHHVLIASNLLSGASQATTAALLLSGHAKLWELAALAAVNSSASAFFYPASAGIVPQTVPVSMLQSANATLRLSINSTNIAGAALGGLLVAATSPACAIGVDAASYGLAALVLAQMRIQAAVRKAGSTVLHELREGWHDFWARTWLWAIVLQFSFVVAAQAGAVNVLGPEVANAHLGGAGPFGIILAASTAGNLVTGFVMLRWRPHRMLRAATFAVFPLALPLLAFAGPAPFVVIAVCAFLAGAAIEVFGVLWDTTMQQEIPQERLSRLAAYDALGSLFLSPLGLAAAGPIAAIIGTRATFIGAAVLIVVATALVFVSRDVRTLERRTV